MLKKIFCALMLLCFAMAVVMPTFATETANPQLTRMQTILSNGSSPAKLGAKPSRASVNIRNIPSGDNVYSDLLIIAQVTGTFSSVVYQIDSGSEDSMIRVGTTDRFQATWDTTKVSASSHTLYVKAKDSSGKVVATASVGVWVVTSYKWELYYEIDYMADHSPPASVLTYIGNYWKGHAIKFNYLLDDEVKDPTNDGYISDSDFWEIENQHNGGADNSKNGYVYTSKEKWVLYGTRDQNENVGGYTYVDIVRRDLLGGNYIFIADSMVDNWEASKGITNDGGEVIVTAHEAGHSIGIAKLSFFGSEVYDSDYYSIMSSMRTQNGKDMSGCWYYSKEYWATANLSYYTL